MDLSLIIPVFNEAGTLLQTLDAVQDHTSGPEIIVVDGGSSDGSVEIARKYTPHVLASSRGRGIQQDNGARHARGDILVFLHADTCLPAEYARHIRRALSDPQVVFGAFFLAIHPPSPILNGIAFAANLRSLLFRLPYGDQALFMRRSAYFKIGGFQPWPIMEDVALVRKLNRIGACKLIREPVKTAARRWEQETPVFTTLRNWSLMIRIRFRKIPRNAIRKTGATDCKINQNVCMDIV